MSLNTKQRQAIELLIEDPFLKKGELAKKIEVDPTTITRWFANEEFNKELDTKFTDQWKDAIHKAQKTVIKLMESNQQPIALGAAKTVLDKAIADKKEILSDGGIDININYGDEDK